MSNLIPKNEYFKLTTRAILSEAEKQETFDAETAPEINHQEANRIYLEQKGLES